VEQDRIRGVQCLYMFERPAEKLLRPYTLPAQDPGKMYAPGPPIRLRKTGFVTYEHADLARAREFFLDFGLRIAHEEPGQSIFFAGYGAEPYVYVAKQGCDHNSFAGASYVAEDFTELERAAALPCATGPIYDLDGPFGGQSVTLRDPAGHLVHIIHGWTEKTSEPPRLEKLVVNFEDEKPRKGKFQRFKPGPAPVFRWGHYGVTYPEGMYQEMLDWYTSVISLAPSDIVFRGEKPITCFFHIDRGEEYSDHHAFFFKMVKSGQAPGVAHAAFEVHDFDIQQLGHQHLTERGYELCWGVGRVSPPVTACSSETDFSLACPGESSLRLLVRYQRIHGGALRRW